MRDPDLAKEAEIDACSWNYFKGITAGSQGVECELLDALEAYANEMENGQKISCKRYLKGTESLKQLFSASILLVVGCGKPLFYRGKTNY